VIPNRGGDAALTVPGTVDGWRLALELSRALGGRLPLNLILERAATLARDGVPVSPSEARFDAAADPEIKTAPGFAATYWIDGKPAPAGTRRAFPALAATLRHLGHEGLDDFYRGDVAREIAIDLEKIGSPLTRADLGAYRARWREPLSLRVGNAIVYNAPPPTQGLAALIMLGLYERLAPRSPDSFEYAHALIEAFKRAAIARDAVCVDVDGAEGEASAKLAPAFLAAEAAAISMSRAAPWPPRAGKGDTVWMGAVDGNGLAVSFLQSLYWEYGSGCVLDRTGVTMANRGKAFSLDPASRLLLKPGKRPFLTLNPPLAVFDDGRALVYGSMGGDGQPQFQAQAFTRIVAGASLADAVAAPRHLFGRTWGDASVTVKIEETYDDSIAAALRRAGHAVERRPASQRDMFGHVGAVMRSPKGAVAATHDPRSDGGAAGI
jgi:gamma-glutamyltranspeptidase/glutathione hydrolase